MSGSVRLSQLPAVTSVQPTDQLELNQGGSSRSATIAQVAALFPFVPHTHPIAGVVGLLDALDGKAPTSHTHGIAEVAGLQGALDAKAATVPGYEWFNTVQELLAVILRGGITPSNLDSEQVRKSLDRLFGGGLANLSANTTLTVDNAGLVLVNASSGNVTLTLPAANGLGGRPQRFTFARSDSALNTVTIQRSGADTIEGLTSFLLAQRGRVTLVSDGVSGWVILAGDVSSSLPPGTILETSMMTALPGTVAANGALLSRSTYPALFAAANAGGLVTEAAWTAGDWGRYSVGDGSTTFRIPDYRGEFRRGADASRGVDAGRTIGSYQKPSVVAGENTSRDTVNTAVIAGALAAWGLEAANIADYSGIQLTSSSTGVSFTSAPSDHIGAVRPRNVATLVCIKF